MSDPKSAIFSAWHENVRRNCHIQLDMYVYNITVNQRTNHNDQVKILPHIFVNSRNVQFYVNIKINLTQGIFHVPYKCIEALFLWDYKRVPSNWFLSRSEMMKTEKILERTCIY